MVHDDLFSRMARELEAHDSTDQALDSICQYACVAVDADDAGIMMVDGKSVDTPASTSQPVLRAHELQAEVGEGPCLAALAGGDPTYLVDDTRTDERWPTWARAAAELGFLSVLSSSLETSSRRFGSLNVYAAAANAFTEEDVEIMQMLATHASVAISAARERSELYKALGTRTAIGQAQGILMQTFDINADQAFAYLRRLSQDRNVKLFKIAEEVIASRDELAHRGERSEG